MEINSESECDKIGDQKTRKRKTYGRLSDASKKINLQSHCMGPDCQCTKKCFEVISADNRIRLLKEFNMMKSVDMQNAYLAGLITVLPIMRRRPRKPEEEARLNEATYKYRVRNIVDGSPRDTEICRKAFISIHGITKSKVEFIVRGLKQDGSVPKDKRGLHKNRPWRLSQQQLSLIRNHIKSFRGRTSHYSLHDTTKIYLPEDLNIKKMHKMFCQEHNSAVSYESYRTIFNNEFNIAFGYPRSDTCSACDEFLAKIKSLQKELKEKQSAEQQGQVNAEITRLQTENKVHNLKAAIFYDRKRQAKSASRKTADKEAICLDFAKNLPLPNISTNDVYYKRQLSMYIFNIHVLSTSESVFYMYSETVAKKGSNEVCSMLHHYVYNYLSLEVRELKIFCDSCSGQNKNFTFFRFLHNLVHAEKRFDTILVTFPIRGHSYLECDKNMGLINQKIRAEVPSDWIAAFQQARMKPSPFIVEECSQTMFRKWKEHLDGIYKKKAPFATRPIREYKVSHEHPRLASFRPSYNGYWETAEIRNRSKIGRNLREGEFLLPEYCYEGRYYFSVYNKQLNVPAFCCSFVTDF